MLELSKSGLSVNDILGATRGVLELSAAANISNARAAEIASNALNAFGLQGSEASRVANLIAAGANASARERSRRRMSENMRDRRALCAWASPLYLICGGAEQRGNGEPDS